MQRNRIREALGRIYDEQPSAFNEYLRRYQQDPTSRVFAPLAEAYRKLGKLDEAIRICQEGMKHHPEFQSGRFALARCYLDQKRFSEARTELERVISHSPDNLLAQKLLGETAMALNDVPLAIHAYRMASSLAPQDVSLGEKLYSLENQPNSQPSRELVEPVRSVEASHENWVGEVTLDFLTGCTREEADDAPPERVLGDEEDEPFSAQHVSTIFAHRECQEREISTETLGDLYFEQGQFQRSLRILEKLSARSHSQRLIKKMDACREKLGVARESLIRNRKIEMLETLLKRLHQLQKDSPASTG